MIQEQFQIVGENITKANPGFSNYIIPKIITCIQDGSKNSYAFQELASRQFEVSFEEGSNLTYIGAYSFYKCSYL